MNINSACILEDRGILFIDGADAKDFLQNIITNDINKVTETRSCFASLLNPQGKFLFEFIVIKHKKGYFIDSEKSQIDELFKQLSLYKLRSNVQILNLSNEFVVAALSYEKFKSIEGSKDELGFTEDGDSSAVKDAANALQSLGYKAGQVNKTLRDLESAGELSGGLEEIIRKALSKMI